MVNNLLEYYCTLINFLCLIQTVELIIFIHNQNMKIKLKLLKCFTEVDDRSKFWKRSENKAYAVMKKLKSVM